MPPQAKLLLAIEPCFSPHYLDKVITIWEGTYYHIQKSEDHEVSRRTYSGHKTIPLVKFMSVVPPDGYVLDVLGLYMNDGKNNDAGITRHIMKTQQELDWMKEEDASWTKVSMMSLSSSYLKKGVPQHSVEAANDSHLITKVYVGLSRCTMDRLRSEHFLTTGYATIIFHIFMHLLESQWQPSMLLDTAT